jgi:hypothetical protein
MGMLVWLDWQSVQRCFNDVVCARFWPFSLARETPRRQKSSPCSVRSLSVAAGLGTSAPRNPYTPNSSRRIRHHPVISFVSYRGNERAVSSFSLVAGASETTGAVLVDRTQSTHPIGSQDVLGRILNRDLVHAAVRMRKSLCVWSAAAGPPWRIE